MGRRDTYSRFDESEPEEVRMDTVYCQACRNWFDLTAEQDETLSNLGVDVAEGTMTGAEAITAVHRCQKPPSTQTPRTLRFVQIAVTGSDEVDSLYGLTAEGEVYRRNFEGRWVALNMQAHDAEDDER